MCDHTASLGSECDWCNCGTEEDSCGQENDRPVCEKEAVSFSNEPSVHMIDIGSESSLAWGKEKSFDMTMSKSTNDEMVQASSSMSMSRSVSTRLTLSIQDLTFLRATRYSTLLDGFGQILRGTPGGIGMTGGSDDYSKSRMVKKIDIFLSHSWHAPWLPKYLVLLLHFNVKPALIITSVSCFACFLMNFSSWAERATLPLSAECWQHYESFPTLRVVGCFIFMVILLQWHSFVCGRFIPDVFLDKVCIDQIDLVRKEQSIKSIGGFLKNSNSVLVAWDSSYFERLWCTFELSAFFHAHPRGEVTFLPCWLGVAVVMICLTTVIVAEVFGTVLQWRHTDSKNIFHYRVVVNTLSNFPVNLLVLPIVRRYLQETSEMDGQLEKFAARNAKCFCCSVGHIHPDTGKELPCDRDVVYASIAEWYGHGDTEKGLRIFDGKIRGPFRKRIQRRMGGSVHFPYTYAMVIGFPAYVRSMAYVFTCPLWVQVVRHAGFMLLRGPILVMIYLKSGQMFQKRRQSVCREFLNVAAASLVATFLTNLYEFTRDLYWIRSSYYTLLPWYILEALFILWVWRPVDPGLPKYDSGRKARKGGGSANREICVELSVRSEASEERVDASSSESW